MRISDWSSDVCSSELAIEHLQDRHLGAHVRIEAGELDADRARSDHQQLRRHLRRHHRMAIGPDPLPVRLGEGQVARPGTRRDDDVLRSRSTVLSPCLTESLPFAAILPSPVTTVTLFFFIRPVTPALSCPATLRLASPVLPQSNEGFSTDSP